MYLTFFSFFFLGKKSNPKKKKPKKTQNETKKNTKSGRKKKEKKRENKLEKSKRSTWADIKPIRKLLYLQFELSLNREYLLLLEYCNYRFNKRLNTPFYV